MNQLTLDDPPIVDHYRLTIAGDHQPWSPRTWTLSAREILRLAAYSHSHSLLPHALLMWALSPHNPGALFTVVPATTPGDAHPSLCFSIRALPKEPAQ